jgi:TonB-linked SusC/RagA family outer membrane protein
MDHIARAVKGYFLILVFLGPLFGAASALISQENEGEVRGLVTDEIYQAIIGASIQILGTTNGTITNLDGVFNISASIGDTLLISFIGYNKEFVVLQDLSELNLQLSPDVEELEEVVITAFALKREKKTLGYSVQDIKGNELTMATETNVAYAMQGRLSGVQFNRTGSGAGSSTKITIRGTSSLTGSSSPLLVVDGVPMDNSSSNPISANPVTASGDANAYFDYGDGLGNINPEDIESISVLKGPNASALYGTRGANGVILITTKTGKPGSGIGVNYSLSYTLENPLVFPNFQNTYGVGAAGKFPIADNGSGIPSAEGSNASSWGPAFNGFPYINWRGRQSEYVSRGVIMEEFYQAGHTLTNAISLNGGNETSTLYFSANNQRNQGILPNSQFNRWTFTLRGTHQMTKKIRIDSKMSYITSNAESRPTGGGAPFNTMVPFLAMTRDVELKDLEDYKNPDGTPVIPRSGIENPYWITNEFKNSDSRNRFIGLISATYDITENLSLSGRAGVDHYNDARFYHIPKYSSTKPLGYMQYTDFALTESNMDALLKYDKHFNENWFVSVSGGGSILNVKTNTNAINGSQLKAPGIDNISNASIISAATISTQREIQSVYAFAQIGFRNYFFLDLTGRNDWSSVLPEENRSFFYPSASFSFVISDAFELSRTIDVLKLRGSWAQAGSDGTRLYQDRRYLFIESTPTPGGALLTHFPQNLSNLDLRNELTTSVELGLDYYIYLNRLGLQFTFYNAITTDQIMISPVSATSGSLSRTFNAGSVQNQGWEVTLSGKPIVKNQFQWEIQLNLSRNRNMVLELDDEVDELLIGELAGSGNDVRVKAIPGEPMGTIHGKDFVKDENGNIILDNKGLPTATTEDVILGIAQPDYLASLLNTFTWKGIYLNFLIESSQGGEIYSETKFRMDFSGNSIASTDGREFLLIDGVNEDGGINTQQTTQEKYMLSLSSQNIATPFIEDASYISLRELSIGYQFPAKWLKNSLFRGVRISAFGRNLGYIQRKLTHVAPEAAMYSTRTTDIGIEYLPLPMTRNIGVKLNVEF